MIETIEGSEIAIKDEMKSAAKMLPTDGSIRKKYDQLKDLSLSQKQSLDRELSENASLRRLYSVSFMLPIRVGDLVINYLILQKYLKKLRSFKVELEVKFNVLELRYFKGGAGINKSLEIKGTLELFDMAHHFEGFEHIPIAKIG